MWRRQPTFDLRENPGMPLDRLTRAQDIVHILDLKRERPYIEGNPRSLALVDAARARTMLLVPMFKETNWSAPLSSIVRRCGRLGKADRAGQEFRRAGRDRDRKYPLLNSCSTNCANPCSNRRPPLTSSRSSAARRSICNRLRAWPNAVRLCEAERAYIFRFDGALLRAVAGYNVGPANWTSSFKIRSRRGGRVSRRAPRSNVERRKSRIFKLTQTFHMPCGTSNRFGQ